MFKTKRFFVVVLTLVFTFSVGSLLIACGGDAYDDSSLIKRLEQVEKDKVSFSESIDKLKAEITALEKENISSGESIDKLKDELAAAKNKLLLLEGKVDGDPNKVYQLNDTVSYSSNGLKLFEIKVTGIEYESGSSKRTLVRFIFTPYTFVEPTDLSGFLGAQLVNSDQSALNHTGSLTGSPKTFVFANTSLGRKTLYVCINSVNMFLPFALYDLTL